MNLCHKAIKPYTNQKCVVAVSGGVDSVVLFHFLKAYNDVSIVHINHDRNNEYDNKCEQLVRQLANENNVPIEVFHIEEEIPNNVEQRQRDFRQKIFRGYECDVYLGHTLNDQVEEYLMSSIKGNVRFIASVRNNLRRPFLFLTKQELYEYAVKNKLHWLEDSTNFDGSNQRSFCRNTLLPNALMINPGLFKTVARMAKERFSGNE